eukprot:7253069-Alexandrium_andersonii.AAC.1
MGLAPPGTQTRTSARAPKLARRRRLGAKARPAIRASWRLPGVRSPWAFRSCCVCQSSSPGRTAKARALRAPR